jgi:hypothetical protein
MYATINYSMENDHSSLSAARIKGVELRNFQTYLVAFKACCFMVKD